MDKKKRSLGRRILTDMLIVVIMLAVIAAGVFWYTMKNVTDTQSDSNRRLSYTMGTMSSEYMQAQTEKRLRTANAGHEYPIIKKPDGPYELVKDTHGCAVGVFEDEKYKEFEVKLEPGSKLFVYTDGAPEAMAPGDVKNMFGLDRLVEALNREPEASPEVTIKNVSDAIAGFVQNEEQFDDLTMLSFEYRGDAGA